MQAQDVFFDPQVKDFDIIHENGGEVVYQFKLMNFTSEDYKVKGIITSCGCTNVNLSNDTLKKNGVIMVDAGYNPKGRPGYFFKQFTVVLQKTNKDTLAVDGYLKGTVLSSREVQYNPLNLSNTLIQIKPVLLGANSAAEKTAFNTFMNDLTFVLDKDGFANLVLEYYQHDLKEDKLKSLLEKTRQLVTGALEKRGYEPFRVGFAEQKWRDVNDTVEHFPFVILNVSGYGNALLNESKILLKGINLAAFKAAGRDSTVIRYDYSIAGKSAKVNWEKGKAAEFVTHVVRNTLIYGDVKIALYVNGIDAQGQDDFLHSNIQPYLKDFYASLKEQGINFEKLEILPPVFIASGKPEIKFALVEMVEKSDNISWNRFQEHLDSIRRYSAGRTDYEKEFRNNIPVYYQRVEKLDAFDTTSKQFKEWVNLFKSKWEKNKSIRIIVEATASNAPTINKYDNSFVARRRANTTIAALQDYFVKNGIAPTPKMFEQSYALVKGPVYHEQDFALQQYKKYQYVKLLPVETDTLLVQPNGAVPYQVNFNNNDFSLPASGMVFRNFIDNLIPYIDKYGYVELIMESSTSKVPPVHYVSNRVLAFERLQKSKDAVINAIAARGYNPLRVIFVEERILVQGPGYKQGMDPKNEVFKTFQYVKIIPKTFIYR
ncbi:MAG TPA: DUF1573 domain-containing protein [Flavobacteriales bacterium]|nr:DUF1573 domain-containing protein [Flavobacteriales bacterium]